MAQAGRGVAALTSNREPSEWLAMMADPLLAQSAVDRLVSTAHELIIEVDSYRRHQKPHTTPKPTPTPACQLTNRKETTILTDQTRQSLVSIDLMVFTTAVVSPQITAPLACSGT